MPLYQATLRDSAGRDVVAPVRLATPADVPQIEQLIAISTRVLGQGDYNQDQIEAALGSALGVDSQLIQDGTYFVVSVGAALVACGGWSYRKTLFGSDGRANREPETLDPACDAARIRAFFVHPEWARQGLGGLMLDLCEVEMRARGFTSAELMATLPGERLYRARGYVAGLPIEHVLPNGLRIQFVPMRKLLG